MQSGINYFFNFLALDPSLFQVFYQFSGGGSATIPSIQSGSPLYSGQLSSIGSFYSDPARGNFANGQNIKISNDSGLASDYWTMFFVFEKSDAGLGILFSNYHGDTVKSGFAIGVNDANHLFFECYGANGPQVLEADFQLAARNAVSVTKAGNGIYFNYFDFNSRNMLSDNFSVNGSFVVPSSGWYLGDAVNPPSYFSGRAFHGYLDNFLYFNGALMPYQIARMFSGFLIDQASNWVYTFGFDRTNFIEEVDTDDNIELYTFTTATQKTNVNEIGVYGSACGDFILGSDVNQSSVNAYINGVAQVPSGYQVSGSFYDPVIYLSGDYALSGQNVIADGRYGPDDELIYDVVTGARVYYPVPSSYTVSGFIVFLPNSFAGMHVFLNGVKLRSGIDYITFGTQMSAFIGVTGISGAIYGTPVDNNPFSHTFSVNAGSRFARGTSELWRNGMRQSLGSEYIENAYIDLLNGVGAFISKPTLYNNISLFWN